MRYLIPALLIFFASCAVANDNRIVSLSIHTRVDDHDPDFKRFGKYPEVARYNLHRGMAPDLVDVVLKIEGKTNTVAVLEVIPVVGLTDWERTEGTTDFDLLDASKTRLYAYHQRKMPVEITGTAEVTFSDIDIGGIVEDYANRQLWPRELLFRVTLSPIEDERSLRNNVVEHVLILDPPD